jgi:hypothetical protein
VEQIRKYSPYLLVELLLPGGTLIALLLWIWQSRFAVFGRWTAKESDFRNMP